MDYAQLSTNVESIIKTAGSEGGTTSRYNEIMNIDGQRDVVVTHLKHVYDDGTTNMVNAKEVANIANEYKNLETTMSSSVADVRGKVRSADQNVSNAKLELEKKEKVRDLLKILVITLSIVAVLYLLGGSSTWVHLIVLTVLLGGVGYALYKQNTT